MDPPPLPPLPNAATTAANPATTTANPATIQLSYPDSVGSSPRPHPADSTFNETLPPIPGAKLRLMCSYGGHIIPRPHDKNLCYVGGETRMVAIDRHFSLSTFSSRLSRSLLNGRSFTLKYQLPHEDLDSLVSVATDEDLDNMIEEYDRITASSSALSPSRIRLFIFFNKPETAASMGSLLDDAKSETWFVDALNGSGLIPRNLSDSATMDCLVTLDNDHGMEDQAEAVEGENKKAKNELLHEVHTTLSDSPVVEKNSSFGSSSSPPSMSNLPPIRVRVEDPRVGVEEQFSQMTFAQVVQKHDDGYGLLSAPSPPLPISLAAVGTAISINPAGGSSDQLNRVLSDDERSDQGVPVSFRKPPLPVLQPVQHKAGTCYNLPSPDSVASDSSAASASSLSKHMYYQDQAHAAPRDNRAPASPDTKGDIPISSSQIQMQQAFQDSGYALLPQLDQQQQFVPATTHFISHPANTPVPMTSYYPIYAPPSQQPPHPIDPQYPVYLMQVNQPQPYMSMQTNMLDTSRPVTPPTPAYKDSHAPIYPTKTAATSAKPEMASTVYVPSTHPLVQVPANQFQQQYVGYSQMQHPTQSIAVPSAATANYVYSEYANATHDQVYYTPSTQVAPLPPQYQSMTPAAVVALADASKQNNIMQQAIGTSQPL